MFYLIWLNISAILKSLFILCNKDAVTENTELELIENVVVFSHKAKSRGITWYLENNSIIDKFHYKKEELQTVIWKSGELFKYYHDWLLHKNEETIFDCNSSGAPHKHCINTMIAEKTI